MATGERSEAPRAAGNAILEAGTIAGNVYDKYGTTNPVARRLMAGFFTALESMVRRTGACSVHEVGCGEGHLAVRLAAMGIEVRASDVSPSIVEQARSLAAARGAEIDVRAASIYDLDPLADAAELVVCCEVLEHLEDPEQALSMLRCLAVPWLLVSVPREPIWCFANLARGKYLSRLGNTPGHLNHWSRRSFLRFLGRQITVVDVATPLPWIMALCHATATGMNDVPAPIVERP